METKTTTRSTLLTKMKMLISLPLWPMRRLRQKLEQAKNQQEERERRKVVQLQQRK